MTGFSKMNRAQGASAPVKYAISIGFSILCSFIFLTAACLIVYNTSDPGAYERIASYAALCAALFFSGVISARITGDGCIASLIVGGVLAALALFFSLTFFKTNMNFILWLAAHIALPLVSLAGGAVGRKREKKESIRKKIKRLSK